MVTLPGWIETSFVAYVATPQKFWGLSKMGLVTTIIISVILITTVVWLINGTKRRD